MLIPILIDTSDLQGEFSLSKKDVETLIDNTIKSITLEYYRLWQKEASQSLKSTRRRYLDSLVYLDSGWMKGSVVLRDEDPLVMMLEEGVSEFDLKKGFEQSSKKKMKADGTGWYLTIPFRYATPTALGESEIFAGVMSQEIYDVIKPAQANIPIQAGLRSEGLKLEDIPAQFQEKTVRAAIPKSNLLQARQEYIAKSSKFEGLMKIKDSTTGQNSYMSFRRVSDKSDPSSWIHTGLEQRHFAEKAIDKLQIDSIVDRSIDSFLENYLK